MVQHTPPSLFSLFENFDLCIRAGRPPQGGAGGGLLVGVAVNGIPLADAPVLEVFGPTQMLYSSEEEGDNHVVGWEGGEGRKGEGGRGERGGKGGGREGGGVLVCCLP